MDGSIDLVRASINEGDVYKVEDAQSSAIHTIRITKVVDEGSIRELTWVIEESTDPDTLTYSTAYTVKLNKDDYSATIPALFFRQKIDKNVIKSIEFQRNIYNFMISILLNQPKNSLKTTDMLFALRKANYFEDQKDELAKKLIANIGNSNKFGFAITVRGGYVSLDRAKLANTVKRANVVGQKRNVSLSTISQAIKVILTELGYNVVE
jgi:hypothetical protein